MELKTAIRRATQHLLKSEKARTTSLKTVFGETKSETIEIERDPEDKTLLTVETFGYDYEAIRIPQTRKELIRQKMYAQLGFGRINTIRVRYYLDILHRESNH